MRSERDADARLREALDALRKIADGRVPQRGKLRPSYADAANFARAALERIEADRG